MYVGLLSVIVILLSFVVYSVISAVTLFQIDAQLESAANQIIGNLRIDLSGGIQLNRSVLRLDDNLIFKVWGSDGSLAVKSEQADQFSGAIDAKSLVLDKTIFTDIVFYNEPYRVVTVPLEVDQQDYGWVQVATNMTAAQYTQRLLLIVFGASSIFAILVVGILGWFLTGQVLQPLRLMAQATKSITNSGDLSKRIPVGANQNDELSLFALTFNQTLIRLERLFKAQRRLLADVSHELRTPLTVIKGNVGLMRMMKSFDKESLDSIENEVDRLTRMVEDLLLMEQAETGELPLKIEPVVMGELIDEVIEELKVISEGRHVITVENMEPVVVMGDRDRLKQVLLNLGGNSIKYSPDDTKICFSLVSRGDWAEIVVSDEGYGISKEDLNHIFERFYRGDKSRTRPEKAGGFGLGLPIAYWIVRSHKGRMDISTEENHGTTVTILLPSSTGEIPTRPVHETKV
jgi:signal transduction histidine kinase